MCKKPLGYSNHLNYQTNLFKPTKKKNKKKNKINKFKTHKILYQQLNDLYYESTRQIINEVILFKQFNPYLYKKKK